MQTSPAIKPESAVSETTPPKFSLAALRDRRRGRNQQTRTRPNRVCPDCGQMGTVLMAARDVTVYACRNDHQWREWRESRGRG